jgi:ATP-dependent RNA helicase DDX51/DBP6
VQVALLLGQQSFRDEQRRLVTLMPSDLPEPWELSSNTSDSVSSPPPLPPQRHQRQLLPSGSVAAQQQQHRDSLVDIVVCTPGRLVDHLNATPGFTLEHLRFLVQPGGSHSIPENQPTVLRR